MIKAIFFDIDGTLIDFETHSIPESTLQTLYKLQAKGIKLCIASGRPPVQLPLLGDVFNTFPWDGYILLNGQYCMDEHRERFYDCPISQDTFKTLVPYLKTVDYACNVFELDKGYMTSLDEGTYAYYKSIDQLDKLPEIMNPERMYTYPTYQVCPRIPPERDAEFLQHAPHMKSARWTDDFADMIPENGGKPEGVKIMLDKWGIGKEECMAFGDGGNDVSMLEYAGIGVAMGNAKEEVKAHADYVTTNCNDHGIYNAIRHFKVLEED